MTDFPDDDVLEGALPPGPYLVMHAKEDLTFALRRMALEQVAVMIEGFDDEPDDTWLDHKVHLARKAGKRLRGLIRLCRTELGPDSYRWANDTVRDQGRRLSEIRTAKVLLTTLDELVEDAPAVVAEIHELRGLLAQRHKAKLRQLRSDAEGRARARQELTELSARISQIASPPEYEEQDLAALMGAVRRGYRAARRSMRAAKQLDSAHAFHEWRKRINYLRYQLEALSGACDPPVAVLVTTLDELSETVGADHDLADVLAVAAATSADAFAGLTKLIDIRSTELREQSLELGSQVFAMKPTQFADFYTEQARSSP